MSATCSNRYVTGILIAVCFTLLPGCRMGVPLHVWAPAKLRSTVGKRVMVARIVGPADVGDSLHEKLLAAAPNDVGRQVALVASEDVQPSQLDGAVSNHPVALVSYNQSDESDLAVLSKARENGFDYILRGEVLPDRRPRSITEADQQLTVSWRLLPVAPPPRVDRTAGPSGMPVSVDLKDALERYPDLAFALEKKAALHTAVVRDTLPLIAPSVQRTRVQLEIPYLLPGSRQIRRGNAYARAGRWAEAESEWRQALESYPLSSVAVHNLAIAGVAKQDYSTARELARKAVRLKPTRLHKQTLVWVEQIQRSYHEAFGLPDPPEGWFVTRSND